jgi:hypothetical protein
MPEFQRNSVTRDIHMPKIISAAFVTHIVNLWEITRFSGLKWMPGSVLPSDPIILATKGQKTSKVFNHTLLCNTSILC